MDIDLENYRITVENDQCELESFYADDLREAHTRARKLINSYDDKAIVYIKQFDYAEQTHKTIAVKKVS